jgi:hypothetical protein
MPGQRSKGNPDPSRALGPASAVLPLPVAMIEPTFRTPLVSPIGAAPLPAPGLIAAGAAAVALSMITAGAEKKQSAAFATRANPWPRTLPAFEATLHRY